MNVDYAYLHNGMTGEQVFMQVFWSLGKETKQKNESNNYIRTIYIYIYLIIKN